MKNKECHNDLLRWLETDMEFACSVDISHFTAQLPVCTVHVCVGEGGGAGIHIQALLTQS